MTIDPHSLTGFLAFTFGSQELIVLGGIAFLLFGAKKIPELMRSLGRAQGEYQKAKKEFEKEVKAAESETGDLEGVRKEAKDLGIDTEGKDLEALRQEIEDKRSVEG